MDDPNFINMASILDDPEGAYENYKAQSTTYLQAVAMSYGWTCPICGMVNSPNSAICVNSWAMPNGTAVVWKHN